MRKNILIPTDFSKNAFNAITYAFELFKEKECNFHIFHSYFLPRSAKGNLLFPEPEPHEYDEAAKASGLSMLRLKDRVNQLPANSNHTIFFEDKYGTLIDLLNEKVTQDNIALIIMGTRGVTNDVKIAYGRNAVNVMENVKGCPTLAVPANFSYKKLNEIVFPTNFKSHFNELEINTFTTLAAQDKAAIKILHIGKEANLNSKQQENRKLLESYFKDLHYSFHWVEKSSVKEAVLAFVDKENSDLIAFVNRKHWFFGSVFSNPLVKSLGVHSTVPVLALHDTRN